MGGCAYHHGWKLCRRMATFSIFCLPTSQSRYWTQPPSSKLIILFTENGGREWESSQKAKLSCPFLLPHNTHSSSLKSLSPRRSSALLTRCFHSSKFSQAAGVSHMNSPVLSSRSERLKPKLLDTGVSSGCSQSLSHWSQCLPLSLIHTRTVYFLKNQLIQTVSQNFKINIQFVGSWGNFIFKGNHIYSKTMSFEIEPHCT